jgi:hypothetical protein
VALDSSFWQIFSYLCKLRETLAAAKTSKREQKKAITPAEIHSSLALNGKSKHAEDKRYSFENLDT